MANTSIDLLEIILRDCAGAAPQPWYPSVYAQATGVPRDALDASLDQLRLGGLIRLTDWVHGHGQGYVLTPEGVEVLQTPRLLNRLRQGGVPARTAVPAAPVSHAAGRLTSWDRGEAVRAALVNPARPTVTLFLIALNVLMFLVGLVLARQNDVPVTNYLSGKLQRDQVERVWGATGALHAPHVNAKVQWWRLLSYAFVHFGILHIVMNMFVLYSLGPLVERLWGSACFLVIYLLAALGGSCAQMITDPGPWLAGASGALCGLIGSMAAWVYLNRSYLPPTLASDWMRNIVSNVVLIALISLIPGVSWAGHLGGGVAGLVAAVPLTFYRYGHGWQRWLGLAGVLAVPAIAFGLLEVFLQPQREDWRAQTVYKDEIWAAYEREHELWKPEGLIQRFASKTLAERRRDRKEAEEAAAAAAEIQGRMKHLEDLVSGAGPFKKPAVAEVVGAARDYAAAGVQFYGTFRRGLDPEVNWTQHEEQALQQQRAGLTFARGQLEKALVDVGWATSDERPAGRKKPRPE